MLNIFRDSKEKIVRQQFKIWQDACLMFIDDKKALEEPRQKLGSCLFFIGSLDYLCQNNKIDDIKFAKLCTSVLVGEIYPSWFVSSVFINFYVKDIKSKFALEANLEGGKQIRAFLTKENLMSPYVLSTFMRDWARDPDLTTDELSLFVSTK